MLRCIEVAQLTELLAGHCVLPKLGERQHIEGSIAHEVIGVRPAPECLEVLCQPPPLSLHEETDLRHHRCKNSQSTSERPRHLNKAEHRPRAALVKTLRCCANHRPLDLTGLLNAKDLNSDQIKHASSRKIVLAHREPVSSSRKASFVKMEQLTSKFGRRDGNLCGFKVGLANLILHGTKSLNARSKILSKSVSSRLAQPMHRPPTVILMHWLGADERGPCSKCPLAP